MNFERKKLNIVHFLEEHDILWMPINLEIKNGKKFLKPYKEESKRPSYSDFWRNVDLVKKRQAYLYPNIWVDTSQVFQIDVDDVDTDFDYERMKEVFPYFLSVNKKLPHFFVKINESNEFKYKRYKFCDNTTELLCGQGSYCSIDSDVVNPDSEMTISLTDLYNTIPNFNDEFTDENKIENDVSGNYTKSNMSDTTKLDLVNMIGIEFIDEYDSWRNIIWAMRNEDYTYDDSQKISMKSENYDLKGFNTVWKSRNYNEHKWTMGTLRHYAKMTNIGHYKKLIENEKIIERNTNKILNCQGTNGELAEILYEKHKNEFVCAAPKANLWYVFDGSRWIVDTDCIRLEERIEELHYEFESSKSLVTLHASIDELGSASGNSTNSVQRQINRLSKVSRDLRNQATIINVMRSARRKFFDGKFLEMLDTNPNLIGFDNGVYDLKGGFFRNGKPSDRISLSVGYNYILETDCVYRNFVIDYMKKLLFEDDVRKYTLQMLARQLYGDNGSELLHFHSGIGSNGKSGLFNILNDIFGDYISSFSVQHLVNDSSKKDPRAPDPEMSTWRGRRFLYTSEPDENDKIHDGNIKSKTGGENIKYRLCNQNELYTFKPMYKMHLMCNNFPNINGNDPAIVRRIRTIPYKTKFVSKDEVDEKLHKYEKNMSILEQFNDPICRCEFIKYIFEHFDFNWTYDAPQVIKEHSKKYTEECNKLGEFVKLHLEKTEKFITMKEIKDLIKDNDEYRNQIKTGNGFKRNLENTLQTGCVDQKFINNTNYKNVFMNWSKRSTVSDILFECQ